MNAARNKKRRALSGDRINLLRRASYAKDPAKAISQRLKWRKKNWDKVLVSRRKPQYAIASKLRIRVLSAIKASNGKKESATSILVGCSTAQLMHHLESQFKAGMTWENHGRWHIDHKKPCASFNLVDPEEQKKCFHFTNLQPLWGVDNLKKGSRIYILTQ